MCSNDNPGYAINGFLGKGDGSIVLSNFQCKGTEKRLQDCPFGIWGKIESYCAHHDDAGCWCQRPGGYMYTGWCAFK